MSKILPVATIVGTTICMTVIGWSTATRHQPKQSIARRASYIVMDPRGENLPSLFANRSTTAVYVAFYDKYSRNLGKVGHTGVCAPKVAYRSSWWGDLKRNISTWTVHAQPPPCTNCAFYINAPCPDPDCYSTYCYNFGPGCFEQPNDCYCNIALDCDCGWGG